jgi:hypothetical protein
MKSGRTLPVSKGRSLREDGRVSSSGINVVPYLFGTSPISATVMECPFPSCQLSQRGGHHGFMSYLVRLARSRALDGLYPLIKIEKSRLSG